MPMLGVWQLSGREIISSPNSVTSATQRVAHLEQELQVLKYRVGYLERLLGIEPDGYRRLCGHSESREVHNGAELVQVCTQCGRRCGDADGSE